MPTLTRPDGRPIEDAAEINSILRRLGLTVASVTLPAASALDQVLADHHLDDARTNAILDAVDALLPGDFAGRDVVALFADTPGLDGILASFHRAHRHSDAETRCILAGAGVFGFVLPDGEQVEITVVAGDQIGVPAGTEHWFRLTGEYCVVAVRLFQKNPCWRADYTGTPLQFPH